MELEQIKKSILEIRGKKVMLDMDLAIIYEVETRVLKQAVRRNIDRFPDDFMFELTKEEWDSLRSQIVMFKTGKGNFPKYLPFAFTEQGVAMLKCSVKFKTCCSNKHSHYTCLCNDAPICFNLSRTFRKTHRT